MDRNGVDQLVGKYIGIWNESDGRIRRELIEEVFTPNATYTDPNIVAHGAAAIGDYLAMAQRNFTGMLFTLGPVLTHHDAVHFSWQVGPAGGAPVVSGFDVATFEGGRINRLYGFFKGY
ncbi:nuclear transport factor 2 family protein [Kitasatospora sp. NPDC048298]|uniref:nuclear transport factor 2 family protein n=1 Tax=Kitasatospora sp. NPDC048298 TaxID=3364049 RepID=UPI00371A1C26